MSSNKSNNGLSLRGLYQSRKLISRLAVNDFKTKFSGSYLGIVWAFVQPIVTILVYWFVFEKGLKQVGTNTREGVEVPFVLWLVAGMVPWFFFSEALSGGTRALLDYSYLVKKVVFQINVLPIIKVISALFVHLFFLMFALMLFGGYRYVPDAYTLQVVYYSFCMFMLVIGICYATSAIVVFFRDLNQVINIVIQVGVWVTPIMWDPNTMGLSPIWILLLKLNPLYYIVLGYRDALINKVAFWEHPALTLYFWVFTLACLIVGSHIFKKLRTHFADVL